MCVSSILNTQARKRKRKRPKTSRARKSRKRTGLRTSGWPTLRSRQNESWGNALAQPDPFVDQHACGSLRTLDRKIIASGCVDFRAH